MRVRVLGPLEVLTGGQPSQLGGPKQRTVLALLAAEHDRVVPTDVLIDGVWGEEPTPGAKGTLQTYISNLRSALGRALVREGGGYRLDVDPEEIDSRVFESSVDSARQLIEHQPMDASRRIRESLALWRGLPYSDTSPSLRLEEDARRLTELRVAAVEGAIDAELNLGYDAELVSELEVLSAEHPLRERFRAQLMLALYRSGRHAEALRAYARIRHQFGEELGIEPSPLLQELEQQMLEHDPTLLVEPYPRVETRAFFLVSWDDLPGTDRHSVDAWKELLVRCVAESGGSIARRSRQGMHAVFGDVGGALASAVSVLERLRDDPSGAPELAIRMAIDVGEVEARAGEYFGPPLNRCARLVAAAHGGQVLMSDDAHALLSTDVGGWRAKALGAHDFRGLGRSQPVFQLIVEGLPETFPPLRLDRPAALPATGFGRMVRGYEIREPVATGESGVVYHGFQPSVGREVAIRVISPEQANQSEFIARFEAEARLVARLDHPHIIELHDYWRDPGGAYLVTQWLGGGSLLEWLQRGPLELEEALRLVEHVGDALGYAHRQGVIHGEVGPEAVLVDDEGNAYVTGFQVAHEDGWREQISTGVARDVQDLARLASRLLSEDEGIDEAVRDLLERAGSSESVFESVEDFLARLDSVVARVSISARSPTPLSNPYKGLRAFDESDQADFHGRSLLVSDLVEAVSDHRLTAVVGPSGIGKSSVVRAGLVPALRRGAIRGSDRWLTTDITPGAFPFEAIEAALSRVATRWPRASFEQLTADGSGMARMIDACLPADATLLLVIDQFEELFTSVPDEETRRQFVEGLVDLVEREGSRVRVVVTLRADYLDVPLGYPVLGDLIREGMVVVPAPSEDELAEAIRMPAERVGVGFEQGLVTRIIEDVAIEPGGLPLLQYALTEMFAHRGGDTLTLEDYQAVGGVLGALGSRAEALYTELGESARRVAPDVFGRLVTVAETGRPSRRRALRRDLNLLDVDSDAIREVIDRYGDHRLLTFDRDPTTRSPTVEVAHEALVARWDRYHTWIEDRREDLLLHDRLAGAVREWQETREDTSFLLQGGRLDHLEAWADRADLALTHDERRFLTESRVANDARETRRRRVRAGVTAGLAAAAVIASGLAIFALDSRQDARRASQLATSRELAASAVNVVEQDSELSLLLAMEAIESAPEGDTPPLEAVSALHEAVRSSRSVLSRPWDQQLPGANFDAVLSPDGALVAATAGSETLQVWESGSGDVVWEITDEAGGGWFSHPRFSPDGSLLVSAFTRYWTEERLVDGGLATGIYLFDPVNGDIVDVLAPSECDWVGLPVRQAFTADGTHLIRLVDPGVPPDGCYDGSLRLELVDLASLDASESIEVVAPQGEGSDTFLWAAADVSRGRVLLSDSSAPNGVTRMIDLDTGETLWERGSVFGIPSPDWSLVALGATSAAQRSVVLVDPETGDTVQELIGHSAEAVDVVFSSDARLAYTAGHDGTARVWDTTTGANVLTLVGLSEGLDRVSVDDRGQRLGAAGLGRMARIWDLTEEPLGEGMAVALSPAQIATRGIDVADGLVGVSTIEGECPDQLMSGLMLDATTGEVVHSFEDFRSQVLAMTPDGSGLIHQHPINHGPDIPCHEVEDGPLVVRDTTSGGIETELEGLCDWVVPQDCAMPPERPYADFVQGISVNGDGTLAAASGSSLAVSIWDLATGEVMDTWTVAEPGTPGYVTGVAIHPEGSAVAAFLLAESGDEVQISDLEGNPVAELDLVGNANQSGHIAFSPDGFLLAVGGRQLTVVDSSTWTTRWEVDAHEGGVFHLDFSPNGTRIATTGSDGFVRIWSAEDGALLQVIPMGDDWAKAVAFNDDSHIVVGTLGGLVATLTLDVDELVEIGRSRLTRGLTDQECQTYLHQSACSTP